MTHIDPRPNLIASASQFYQLGWMVGTVGNLSARLDDGSFWITASGKSKGRLQTHDFVRLALDGTILETPKPGDRPSAETSIHQAIYSLFPDAKVCYHVHSVEANLVSRLIENDELPLPALEMIKVFGIWEEHPQIAMPVFKNYLDVPRIGQEIRDRFSTKPPEIPALLIAHHGITVWAESHERAEHFVETAEYIFRYIIAAHQAGIPSVIAK